MLYLLALTYVVVFTVHQILGFSVGMGALVVAIIFSLRPGGGFRWTRKDTLYALYATLSLVPALRLFDPYDFTFYLRVVAYPWAVSVVFQSIRWDWKRIQLWVGLTVGVCLFTTGLMLFQESPGSFDVSLDRLLTLDRTRGFYFKGEERTGPNAAAGMSVTGIALIMALVRFRKCPPAIGIPLLALLGLMLGVAGGRIAMAGLVGLIGLFVITGLVTREGSRIRHLAVTGVLLVVLVAGGLSLFEVLSTTQGDAFRERVEGVSNPLEDHNLVVRLTDWARAVEMIRDEPWGRGFNAYYQIYERTPHNELLGQWIGGGWPGMVMYFLVMGYVTWRSTRAVLFERGNDEEAFGHYVALSALGITWLAMITENISRGGMNTMYPIVWMSIGLSFARSRGPRDMFLRAVPSTNAHAEVARIAESLEEGPEWGV